MAGKRIVWFQIGIACLLSHGLSQSVFGTTLEEHVNNWEQINTQAVKAYQNGDYRKGIPYAEKAHQYAISHLGKDHPDTLISINGLANLYTSQGRCGEAEPLYKECLELSGKVLGKEHPQTLVFTNNLANLYTSQGRYGEAEPLYKECLQLSEKLLGKEHPQTLRSIHSLAVLYTEQGRYGEAESLLKECLQLSEKVLGKKHPNRLKAIYSLAALYKFQGRYGEAEPLLKKCLELREKILGKEHTDTLNSIYSLAFLHLAQGRLEEAYDVFKYENSGCGLGKFKDENRACGLGKYYLAKKQWIEAERQWDQALINVQKQEKPVMEWLIADHIGLGLALEGQRRYPASKEHFQKAVDLIETQWQALSPSARRNFMSGITGDDFARIEPYEAMVRVLLKEGKKDCENEAFKYAERVIH